MSPSSLPECFFPRFGRKINLDTASKVDLAEFRAYCERTQKYTLLFGELVTEFENQILESLTHEIRVYTTVRQGVLSSDGARRIEEVLEAEIHRVLEVARRLWVQMCEREGLDPLDTVQVSHRCLEQTLVWNGLAGSRIEEPR